MNKPEHFYILIGCEESQAICIEFRKLGFMAFSCDLKPCSGGHPEWHLQMDVFEAIKIRQWDYAMFHPECTYVAGSSVQWLSHPEDKHLPFNARREHPLYIGRRIKMRDSIEFVKALYNCKIQYLDIENPIGLLSSQWQKPSQIIQPYHFGDEATKTTCIWSKNLPLLQHTDIVGKGERTIFSSGKSHPAWYTAGRSLSKSERQELRSKTFPGIAKAVAKQRGDFLLQLTEHYTTNFIDQD